MANLNNNFQQEENQTTFQDYINIIRTNLFPIILITLTSLAFAALYAINAVNIYKSTTSLKISKPGGSILQSPLIPEFQDFGSDRFIANEIEVLKSYTIREKSAKALIDSFYAIGVNDSFSLLLDKEILGEDEKTKILPKSSITDLLEKAVTIEQKRGLDIVEISVQSPSPFEAALIANVYANSYRQLNLEFNRNQLTVVKRFLEEQRNEKLEDLNTAEEDLRRFQQQGGVFALDQQANALITQLSSFEAQRNLAKIQLSAAEKTLLAYKSELKKKDPQLSAYLESFATEEYLKTLQIELAKLEINRDLAITSGKNIDENSKTVQDYNKKIKELKDKLEKKIEIVKAGIFASSPEEIKTLTQNIIEQEVAALSFKTTIDQLDVIVKNYETKFNQLPKSSIDFARFQRQRESLEKLFVLVEEKYQEAIINEQSQPGNVLIIDVARRPFAPSKPNRLLIVLVGFVLGGGIAFGYAFMKNYFDNTVKTPEDLQKKNINVLSWIPQVEGISVNGTKEFEFIVAKKPDSIPSEAFRALRTRIQFSKVEGEAIHTILVTSSAPSEGKTMICTNLAASFAQSGKKVLVIDCDLRKPRVHSFFQVNRFPGLVDYLFGQNSLEEIVRDSEVNGLSFITCGTIPPNPAELLQSQKMKEFLTILRSKYDMILLDSPPVIAVTDSEILARIADVTMLVVSANTTEMELISKAVEIIDQNGVTFIGTVLNNFVYRSSYGSYYKYYYYYTRPKTPDTTKITQQISNN